MKMNKIWAVAAKDIRSIKSSTQVWLGLVLLPVLFSVVLPGALVLFAKFGDLASLEGEPALMRMIENFPAGTEREFLQELPSIRHQIIYLFTNYMLGSFFLLIPVLNALMIALNAMVGEKERRTLESLLFAPIDVKSLFIGKILASFLPTFAITLISFVLCGGVVNALAYDMFHRLIFPNWNWIIIVLWVAPLFTLFAILISTFVSARTKGFQEAQQLGGLVVLPIIAIALSQISGFVFLNAYILIVLGVVLLAIDYLLLTQLAKKNPRHVLFEKQVN
jgi:ABC-2 type transport system permease protein